MCIYLHCVTDTFIVCSIHEPMTHSKYSVELLSKTVKTSVFFNHCGGVLVTMDRLRTDT